MIFLEKEILVIMGSCKQLFELYRNAKCKQIDPMIVLNCKCGEYVPLDVVVTEFKSAVCNEDNYSYQILRKYLVSIFGSKIINDLEVIQ